MQTDTKQAIGGLIIIVAAFAFGRYSAPVKIKTETKTVEVEKKSEEAKTNTDTSKHRKTVVREVVKLDGTKEVVTTTTEDTNTQKASDIAKMDATAKSIDQTKEVTRSSSRLSIAALVGAPLSFSSIVPVYGGAVSKDVLGPVSLGVWGLTSREVGFSAGLTF